MSHTLTNPNFTPSRTLVAAVAVSIALHVGVASGFLGQLQALFEAVTYTPPPRAEPLKARLIAPAPVIEREAAPVAVRPGAQVVATAPAAAGAAAKPDAPAKKANTAPKPKPENKSGPENKLPEKLPESAPISATQPAEPEKAEPAKPEPVVVPVPAVAPVATAPEAPVPVKIKLSPFPLEASVSFNFVGTDPKVTNPYHGSMRHHWREFTEGGVSRYVVKGEANVAFIANEMMTSEGVINEKGLSPTRHERVRGRREPEVITFTPGSQVAVVESKGEKRELKFAGDPVDMLSILYDLALDPAVAVGRKFAFARGVTVYQFVLRNKGQQAIETDAGKLDALYFDFRRVEGEGQIEVWLALDKGLLPAKMRLVSSRGEQVEIIASKYDITKPR